MDTHVVPVPPAGQRFLLRFTVKPNFWYREARRTRLPVKS